MVYISGGNELLNADELLGHLAITEGMRLADLGCGGHGRFIIPAARLVGKKGVAYAVDILKSALEETAHKARLEGVGNLKTVWADLESVGAAKIPSASLDVAFLKNVLFQSKEHSRIFQEAYRLLKPGGQLLVADWRETATPFGPPLIDRVSAKTAKAQAAATGFRVVEEFNAGAYHYGLVFVKPLTK